MDADPPPQGVNFPRRITVKPETCSFILGNPPFLGAKIQSEKQRAQVRRIAKLGGSGGSLDYVAAWFIKAGEYSLGSSARIGFVATNSITQGEQVAQLWQVLFGRCKLEIAFAHRTFEWLSDARGRAHVHCVILGLARRGVEPKEKRLYTYTEVDGDPIESHHAALSPYLFDASQLQNRHLVVEEVSRPLANAKRLIIGSKPIDGGYYLFDESEHQRFLLEEPAAAKFLRPFVGAEDFVNGQTRYILVLNDAAPHELRALPKVLERIELVRRYRRGEIPARKKAEKGETKVKKRGDGTIELANTPTRFHVTVLPEKPYLVFPRHSSEKREYAPFGWLEPPAVPGDSSLVLLDADLWDFGLVTSRMHMAWLKYIGGRLESRYRYSAGIVYNPFPWPEAPERKRGNIRTLAQTVLDCRAKHPGATLADLYDPRAMPDELRKAHSALDLAVDGLYRKEVFASDRERVEHLFTLYEKLTAPMLVGSTKRRRTRNKALAPAT